MESNKTIILLPTEIEGARFRELHPEIEVVICGVGMAAAAATMARLASRERAPKRVILAGIAGAYDTTIYPVGSVVEVVSEHIEELPARFQRIYNSTPYFGLPTARGNSVNSCHPDCQHSDVESMEGAAVAAICEEFNIPFSQIRAISNRVGDPTQLWHIEPAIEALTTTLSEILK